MKVTAGTTPGPVSETDYTYFRGMDGDTLPSSGIRSASVTDSRNDAAVTDLNQYAGQTYETITHDGTSSDPVVTDTITDPWTSTAQATHNLTGGLPAQQVLPHRHQPSACLHPAVQRKNPADGDRLHPRQPGPGHPDQRPR